jgi:ADP-heptose:LPS heptosyltransferase
MMLSHFFNFIQKILFYLLFIIPSIGIAFLKRFFRSMRKEALSQKPVRAIAVFQLGHLGDCIHTIPLLRNLRKNFQSASIVIIGGVWNEKLSRNFPYVDDYIVFNNWLWDRRKNRSFLRFIGHFFQTLYKINRANFDIGLDLKGHINSIFLLYASNIRKSVGFNHKNHGALLDYRVPFNPALYEKDRLLSILPAFGAKIFDEHFEFFITKEKEQSPYDLPQLKIINPETPIVVIFPGAPLAPRRWPAERFSALSEQIIERGIGTPFFIGGEADRPIMERIKGFSRRELLYWIGNDIKIMAFIISKGTVFVGNDTGPLHIAVALNVPTIAFFSSGNRDRWAPRNPHIVLHADVSCSPCDLESDICNHPDVHCIDQISVEDAYHAVESKLVKK